MINCLIVDDEPIALDILESYVRKTPFLELKGRCNGVVEALQQMQGQSIDLLFLDIQMPDVNGIEFSRTLSDKIKVIFTTAFEQYALEGFKVNALDYLLKPFNYQEFLKAAMKAKTWFDLVENKAASPAVTKDSLLVNSDYKLIKIDLKDVLYFEGLKDYVKIYMEGVARPVMTLMTLKSLEEQLPVEKFMRVHRSFIVNLERINAIERSAILIDKASIPIADKYKEQFNDFLSKRFLR
jgi:DNA-binding LytR/AlgR family response regulator